MIRQGNKKLSAYHVAGGKTLDAAIEEYVERHEITRLYKTTCIERGLSVYHVAGEKTLNVAIEDVERHEATRL